MAVHWNLRGSISKNPSNSLNWTQRWGRIMWRQRVFHRWMLPLHLNVLPGQPMEATLIMEAAVFLLKISKATGNTKSWYLAEAVLQEPLIGGKMRETAKSLLKTQELITITNSFYMWSASSQTVKWTNSFNNRKSWTISKNFLISTCLSRSW